MFSSQATFVFNQSKLIRCSLQEYGMCNHYIYLPCFFFNLWFWIFFGFYVPYTVEVLSLCNCIMIHKKSYLPVTVMIPETCFSVFTVVYIKHFVVVHVNGTTHFCGTKFMMPNAETVLSCELQVYYKLLFCLTIGPAMKSDKLVRE